MDLNIFSDGSPAALNIEEVSWSQVRKQVQKVNPELFEHIEALSPGPHLNFLKARYPYGATILDNGDLFLPKKSGESIRLSSKIISHDIKEKLGYSSIPLALLLNKGSEVFVRNGDNTVPLRLMTVGSLFGLFELVNTLCNIKAKPIWCVTSGVRNICMLPKITDKVGYQNIKKELGLSLESPHALSDHFDVFKQIAQHPKFINQWYSEVLFFPATWFKYDFKDTQWALFYSYLFKKNSEILGALSDERMFSILWQALLAILRNRRIKPGNYILETLRQLISIAAGILPGFRPSGASQEAAPIQLLQAVYVDVYGLKNHLPTVVHTHGFSNEKNSLPVYYSFNFPTIIEIISQSVRSPVDMMSNLRELDRMIAILREAPQVEGTVLMKAMPLLKNIDYTLFHTAVDIHDEINLAKEMPKEDPDLLVDKKNYPTREFCATAPFLNGCIRISHSLPRNGAPSKN